eukprot:gene6444-7107_t
MKAFKIATRVLTSKPRIIRPFSTSNEPPLPGLSSSQAEKVYNRNNQMRSEYEAIKPNMNEKEFDEVRRKRLIYRSKQRGWLEVDILLGSWAARHVPQLTKEQMDDYEAILREETIDIFNFVSGKDALPERLQGSQIMKQLQEYAMKSEVTDPERYEQIKTTTNLI